jgi:hypothetical protein
MSRWPSLDDYSEALYDPETAFKVGSKLRSATFVQQEYSHIYSSGTFAGIVRAKIQGENWAVRFLLRNQDDAEKRYAAISKLSKDSRKYLLDTEYLPKEIFIEALNNSFPVILIKWVDGENLSDYLLKACNNSDTDAIRNAAEMIREMRSYMRKHEIAHGDLSPENIMVTGKGGNLKLVLVDYDSMYLPAIASLPCDVGRGKMQHPKRPEKPRPIGMWADEMAYLIYDAGLNALSRHPELGVTPGLFEQKFLVAVDELLSRSSPIIEKLNIDELNLFESAANYAEGEYGPSSDAPEPLVKVDNRKREKTFTEQELKIPLYELALHLQLSPQVLADLADSLGMPDKSSSSLLTQSEQQILKSAVEKKEVTKIQPRSLSSIAKELSIPIDLVLITAKNKLNLGIHTRANGNLVLSSYDYDKVREELYPLSPQSRFRNQFTYHIEYTDILGINLKTAKEIIQTEKFNNALDAPRNEHVIIANGHVRLTQHALNTLKRLHDDSNAADIPLGPELLEPAISSPIRPPLGFFPIAYAIEKVGISLHEATQILSFELFDIALKAPRREHVFFINNEINLSQHGINTLRAVKEGKVSAQQIKKKVEDESFNSRGSNDGPPAITNDLPLPGITAKSHFEERPTKNFVATLDQCATKFDLTLQSLRLILSGQNFRMRLGEPLQEHTSSRRLRGSTQITDVALASLEYACGTKNQFLAPKVQAELPSNVKSLTPNAAENPTTGQDKTQNQLSERKSIEDRFPYTLGDCSYSLSVDITWVFNALKNPKFTELLGEPLNSHLSSKSIFSHTRISLKASQCLADIFNSLDKNSNTVYKISSKPGRKPHLVAPMNRIWPFLLFLGPLLTIVTFVLAARRVQDQSGWSWWFFYLKFAVQESHNDVLYIWGAGLSLAAYLVSILLLFIGFYFDWRISQTVPRRLLGVVLLSARVIAGFCIAAFNAAHIQRYSKLENLFDVFYEFQVRNPYLYDHVAELSLVGIAILALFDFALFRYLYRGRIEPS